MEWLHLTEQEADARVIALRNAQDAYNRVTKKLASQTPTSMCDAAVFQAIHTQTRAPRGEYTQFEQDSGPRKSLVISQQIDKLSLEDSWVPFYLGLRGYDVDFIGQSYAQKDMGISAELTQRPFNMRYPANLRFKQRIQSRQTNPSGAPLYNGFYDIIYYEPSIPLGGAEECLDDVLEKSNWLLPGGRLIVPSAASLEPIANAVRQFQHDIFPTITFDAENPEQAELAAAGLLNGSSPKVRCLTRPA